MEAMERGEVFQLLLGPPHHYTNLLPGKTSMPPICSLNQYFDSHLAPPRKVEAIHSLPSKPIRRYDGELRRFNWVSFSNPV